MIPELRWQIGNLLLGGQPRIVVPVLDRDISSASDALAKNADVLELRIDQFADRSPPSVVRVAKRAQQLYRPLLATVRSQQEGGGPGLTEGQRLDLYHAVAPVVDAIDVELKAPIRDDVVSLCRERSIPVILSFHDFGGTPATTMLDELVEDGFQAGASVVKIATTAADVSDADLLLHLLLRHRNRGIIVLGMGAAGMITRLAFPFFGSLLTYGYFESANAPGQLSAGELADFYRRSAKMGRQ